MLAISRFAVELARVACAAALLVVAWAPRAQDGPLPDLVFGDGFETAPIVAPPNTWSFVPFANAFCGNNTTTGLGINPSSVPNSRVVLFLTGGGACWDTLTCITFQTAAYYNTGYGPAEFTNDIPMISTGFFDRGAATNPFRDYHYVYVPYCSGDIHFGNNPAINYGGNARSHRGYTNLSAYLERIVATFPSAPRVVLAGASAGGFGAALNWSRVQQAFGNIRVDMIDDSGTFMPANIVSPSSAAEQARFTNWNLATTLPVGCADCFGNGLDNIYTFNAAQLPNNRGALLSYRPDPTIANFYQISQANFTTGLNQNLVNRWDPFPSKRYFIVGSSGHVLFVNPALSSGGVTLETFLTRMVTDDPAWANVTP